jgi:hypothetical protein
MTDWKLAARALDAGISEKDLAGMAAALEALEEVFRPLVKTIPHETEPSVKLGCPREEGA